MNFRKAVARSIAIAIVLMPLAACGNHNYDLECDRGDQIEHDSDCGYVDSVSNQWMWFSWVKTGQVSHSPDNWEPPAGVTIQEDAPSHPKPKKTKAVKKK